MLRTSLLVGGLIVLIYLVVQVGLPEILALLSRVGWGFLSIAAIYAGHEALRASALRLSAVRPGAVAFWEVFATRLSGEAIQFLTSTGPFLAEPSKALLLKQRGLTGPEAFAATIGEYLAYTFVAAAMLTAAMEYFLTSLDIGPALRPGAIALLAVGVGFLGVSAVAISRRVYLIGGIVKRLSELPIVGGRLRVDTHDVRHMEDLLLQVIRDKRGRFMQILIIEMIAHACLVIELWWILKMTGVASDFETAFLLESAGKFTALAFFFVPGQVGAAEGVNVLLFRALNLSAAAGVGVALVRRIRGMMVAGAGLTALAFLTRRLSSNGANSSKTTLDA